MHYVHIASNEKREGEKDELIKYQKLCYVFTIYFLVCLYTVDFMNWLIPVHF